MSERYTLKKDTGERYTLAREMFDIRMRQGTRPLIYTLKRLAGGEYVSQFTEMAWKEYLAGWLDARGSTL